MANKPVLHRRDHERGGADPIRLLWTDEPGGGGGGGVNDATFDTTFVNYGTAANTGVGTFTNGTTPGSWLALDGAQMQCEYAANWSIDIAGTIEHSGESVLTALLLTLGGTDIATLFNATMGPGDSAPIGWTGSASIFAGNNVFLRAGHGGLGGDASTHVTGTIVFALEP